MITAVHAAMLIGITFVLTWRGRETQKTIRQMVMVDSRAVATLEQFQRNHNALRMKWIEAAPGIEAQPDLVRRYRAVTQLLAGLPEEESEALRSMNDAFAETLERDAQQWPSLPPDVRQQRLSEMAFASERIRKVTEALNTAKRQEVERRIPQLEIDARNTMLVALGIAWIVAVLSFVIARLTLAKVVTPLERLTQAAERLAGGDFSARVQPAGAREIHRLGVEFNDMAAQLKSAKERLERQARTDELTGLPNFRSFSEGLELEIERFNRYEKPFGLLVFDLDRFKSYNDDYGHVAGNEALQAVATVIRATLRAVDLPARYGGEEFVAVVPEIDWRGLAATAERIRRNVEALPPIEGRRGITVSIGGALFPSDGTTAAELFAAADRRLYEAKEGGRNRVSIPADAAVGAKRT